MPISYPTDNPAGPASGGPPEDGPKDAQVVYLRWKKELDAADRHERSWRERAKKVVKRYRDEEVLDDARTDYDSEVRFNILFANTQVLKSQIYQKSPVPDVRRRFNDRDPVARQAALVLQRALTYSIDAPCCDFDMVYEAIAEDVLLPGRGLNIVRYYPVMGQVAQPVIDPQTQQPMLDPATGQPVTQMVEQVVSEDVYPEYVEWEWLRISPAKHWKKVRWVAFGELLTRAELVRQFGEAIGNATKLDWKPDDTEREAPQDEDKHRALVWMIWSKTDRKVYAISRGYTQGPLRVVDDPLGLECFFPCAMPVYADTKTSCSLVPIPEYVQYQALAIELDLVTERIAVLVDALRRRGVYDANQPELERLAKAGDNEFVPVTNYTALLEKGGIQNALVELPIETLSKVVLSLYQQREQIKGVIYEVTGISDIVRGATKPSETLGAQQLKAQYAGTRIGKRQKALQLNARDTLRIMAEIISEKFSPQSLKMMTGPEMWMIDAPQPQPDGTVVMGKADATNEIMTLLRNEKLRGFRIDIETDSTIQPHAEEEQKNRVEFLAAVTQYIGQVSPLVAQGAIPLDTAKEFLAFGARGFRVSPQLEEAIDRLGGDEGQKKQQQALAQQVQQATSAAGVREANAKAAEAEQRAKKIALECQILEMQIASGQLALSQQATPPAVGVPQANMAGAAPAPASAAPMPMPQPPLGGIQ